MSLLNPNDPFNPTSSRDASEPHRVVIADMDMTIGAMCRFMVKWAIASIPAAILIFIVYALCAAISLAAFRSITGP
jgi:hypothetical protein